MTWYIQLHQQQLVSLMDQIASFLPGVDINELQIIPDALCWPNLAKVVYDSLERFLTFLESEFPAYLNPDCRIPAARLRNAIPDLSANYQYLFDNFRNNGIDEDLLQVTLQPFLDVIHADQVSYHQFLYLQTYRRQLSVLLTMQHSDLTAELEQLLHYINFNNVHYVQYAINGISAELDGYPTIREKMNRIIWLQKNIRQIVVKPDTAYSKTHPSLQTALLDWLSIEMKYLKKKETLLGNTTAPDELLRWKDFKVLTTFSVPQLGNILKLLLETELYQNKNKSELLDFFSYFFTTVKQDNVSATSLRANFYKEDASVSRSVRDILIRLANQLYKPEILSK